MWRNADYLGLTAFLLKFIAWTEIQENNVIGSILGTRMEHSEAPMPRSEGCADHRPWVTQYPLFDKKFCVKLELGALLCAV